MSKNEDIIDEATKDDLSDLEKDRQNFLQQIQENSKYFENKITYIGAGSIVLSITFIANLKDTSALSWTIIIGEISLVIGLLMNLLSYLLTNYLSNKCLDKIDVQIENRQRDDRNTTNIMCKDLNKKISTYNFINFLLLVIGLIFTMIFVTHNI